jgi:uncharacterized protein
MNHEALVAHLRGRFPNLLAIYLFGSRADGTAGPQSDFDIAILNDGPLDPLALWDLASDLAEIAAARSISSICAQPRPFCSIKS